MCICVKWVMCICMKCVMCICVICVFCICVRCVMCICVHVKCLYSCVRHNDFLVSQKRQYFHVNTLQGKYHLLASTSNFKKLHFRLPSNQGIQECVIIQRHTQLVWNLSHYKCRKCTFRTNMQSGFCKCINGFVCQQEWLTSNILWDGANKWPRKYCSRKGRTSDQECELG